MMNKRKAARARNHLQGFSLIEMAVVLVIIGLLMGGLLGGLGSQLEQKKVRDTQERIKEASEAIMAFAIANGRLPCPASNSSDSKGDEQPVISISSGECTNHGDGPGRGYVPARTLGLGERALNGVMQDAWGFPIRYAVTQDPYKGTNNNDCYTGSNCNNEHSSNYKNYYNASNSNSSTCQGNSPCFPFTQRDGIKNAYFNNGKIVQREDQPLPENLLQVCKSSPVAAAATTCDGIGKPPADTVAQPAFIVWSTARNGAKSAVNGADEGENLDDDRFYVSRSRTETDPNTSANTDATNKAFDDLLQWRTFERVFQDMGNMGILK